MILLFTLLAVVLCSSSSSSSNSWTKLHRRHHAMMHAAHQPPQPIDRCHRPDRPAVYAGRVRSYFVRAEYDDWDYTPSGMDFRGDKPVEFSEMISVFVTNENAADVCRIGHKYRKARYVGYTDATYSKRLPINPSLGINGPVLRAIVGDRLEVHFQNTLDFGVSMHPHGVRYDKENEGVHSIESGQSFTYKWFADEQSGPAADDVSSVGWAYHSHVDSPAHLNAGLFGHLVITSPHCADWATATPLDVEREFFISYFIIDENATPSELLDENIETRCDKFVGDTEELKADDDFIESNLKHSINGRLVGNLPGVVMRAGEHVRWYLAGFGNEVDLHTAHWHGETLIYEGRRTDTLMLMPAHFALADMVPRGEGRWQHHCHVADHIHAGMQINYRVLPATASDATVAMTPVDHGIEN